MNELDVDYILIDVDYLLNDNQEVTLKELELSVSKLKEQFGARSVLRFDAGWNNVSVYIHPSKKKVKK